MSKRFSFFLAFFFLLAPLETFSQNSKFKVSGLVLGSESEAVAFPNVFVKELNKVCNADENGKFSFEYEKKGTFTFVIHHLNYTEKTLRVKLSGLENEKIKIKLESKKELLEGVEVHGVSLNREKGLDEISPISIKNIPSPFQDFNNILTTLPGVLSNNELSSSYSVRGGNFSENLVYVEDILVYRPLLVRTGQQEGLSFAHPNLVESAHFSSGGWQAEHGGRMSSMLDIKYRTPKQFAGGVSLSLLGFSGNLEGVGLKNKLNYIISARHKRASNLLGTSKLQANYLPKFTDVQSIFRYDLSRSKNKFTTLTGLFSFAKNDYLVEPKGLTDTFGTIGDIKQISVGFEGRDKYNYGIWQGGLKLERKFNYKLSTKVILSGLYSQERDKFDVEEAYRLSDLLDSEDRDEKTRTIAIKTNYRHGRNSLDAKIYTLENKWLYLLGTNHSLKGGLSYSSRDFNSSLEEYNFTDVDDYVVVNRQIETNPSYKESLTQSYLDYEGTIAEKHSYAIGLRTLQLSRTKELLFAPRFRYSYNPFWKRNTIFRFSTGVYYQPAFYRELLDSSSGTLNMGQKTQKMYHFVFSLDHDVKLWGRTFKLDSELFYKFMPHFIPFDQENVKLTYYAFGTGKAYAYGLDFRLSGEFVEGAESWFSLGFLNTKEDVDFDNLGYVRRPTDQRLNMSVFFQDYLPNSESFRAYLNANFITGLPFGFPKDVNNRSSFEGKEYLRVDIGLFKYIKLKSLLNSQSFLKIGIEALSVLNYLNNASYTWIDVSEPNSENSSFVPSPNRLTERFFNLKVEYTF